MAPSGNSGLDSFWKLSDPKDKQRIDAACRILNNLQRQKGDQDDSFKENFDYNLQRLISGLGSEKVSSKKGNFMGLVQMLKLFPEEATVENALKIMNDKFNAKGSKAVSSNLDIHLVVEKIIPITKEWIAHQVLLQKPTENVIY